MTKLTPTPRRIAWALLTALIVASAAGCADNAGSSPAQSSDFEIRAMIASDRQAMHALDERMRRIEDQLQVLSHGGGPAATGDAANAPEPPAAPPAPVAPGASARPGPPAANLGAPPAAAGAPPGAIPAPESAGPSGGDAGAAEAAAPPGAAAAGNPAAGGESETTTIATIGGPGGPGPGSVVPPNEAGTAEAPSGAAAPPSEAGSRPDSEATSDDNGAPEAGGSAGTAEAGNPEAPPAAAPPPSATADEGGPPSAGTAESADNGGGAAAGGGEEVAAVPPSAPPENAPAAASAARWPQDLSQELQSPANAKGGAGKVYRSGLEAMKNHDYSAAVQRFGTVEKKFPHSDLTEPAAYFSANALNEMGKYDQAILQYNDLVMRYPKGKYASEALLREAQAFVQINDKIDARLTLQKLVSEHGGTPQAATANTMMKGLESD